MRNELKPDFTSKAALFAALAEDADAIAARYDAESAAGLCGAARIAAAARADARRYREMAATA